MKRFICYILLTAIISASAEALPLRERIFVQTDKHLYLAGEPILMKFVTTDTELIPLAFSRVAYAELVNDSVSLVRIMVELNNGAGTGRMLLPADLPTGNYRLIAYTNFMRNEGAGVFFEKNIAVINTFLPGTFLSSSMPVETKPEISVEKCDAGTVILQTDATIYTTRTRGELTVSGLPENIHTLSVSIAGKDFVPAAHSVASLFRNNRMKQSTEFSGEFIPEYEGHIITGRIIENQIESLVMSEPFSVESPAIGTIDNLENQNIAEPPVITESSRSFSFDEFARSTTLHEFFTDARLRRNTTGKQEMQALPRGGNHLDVVPDLDHEATFNNDLPESHAARIMAAPAIAFPGTGIRFFAGQTSETGNVRFFTSGISGTREAATVVFNTGEQYRLDILSPFVAQHVVRQMPALQVDSVYYRQLLERSVALQVFRFFEDDNLENQNVSPPHLSFEPSRTYPLDEFTRFATMREVFIEIVPGARFRRNAAGNREMQILTRRGANLEFGTPLVLLDGVPVLDHEAIFNYDPLSVEIINLYFGPFSMGGLRFDGIIEFLTYNRSHQNLNLNRASRVMSYVAPQMPFQFHAPDHSAENSRRSRVPDARHTLLWNPNIKTDGKTTITIPFDTSDLTGEFQVTVKGITKDGKFVFATAFFKVE